MFTMKAAVLAILAVLILHSFALANQELHWLRTPSASASFERMVLDYAQTMEGLSSQTRNVALSSLPLELQKERDHPGLLALHCSLPEYLQLLKDPQSKQALEALHLEFLN